MGIADFSLLLPVFLSIDDNSSVAVLFAVYQDAVWHRLTTVEFSIDFHFPPYWRSKGRRRCSWWFVRATNPSLQLTLLCAACEVFTRTARLRVLNQEEGESTNMVCNKLNGETHCLVGLSYCRLNEGLPQFKVGSHAKYVYYYCSLCLQIMLLGESFVIWHTQKHRGNHTGLEH